MPVDDLVDALRPLVPTEIDAFIPTFSGSTEEYRLAAMTAFADMVSPYYDYSMKLCGIPAVCIEGTMADWKKLLQHWKNVSSILKGHANYFTESVSLIENIIKEVQTPTKEFWSNIFTLTHCGSGSQVVVDGWVQKLFRPPTSLKYIQNFPSSLARIEYKQMDTGRYYKMFRGLMKSTHSGGILVPEFSHKVNEIEGK
jgi:hypothetical protein